METAWKFYTIAADVWSDMLEDCRTAHMSIDCEQYIFEDDTIGKAFAEIFLEKAAQGVTVRLICDMVGSANLYRSSLLKTLQDGGVRVLFFNPISPWRLHTFTSWFFRDHRKFLIIDGLTAYTGGVGVNYKMHDWRDTHIRITGPLLESFAYTFDHMWDITKNGRFLPFQLMNPVQGFSLLTNAPHRRQRFIHRKFLDAIQSATRYMYLTTPYFVPDRVFFRIMRSAARKGIDVRLLVPEKSDVRTADLAARRYFEPALKAGVKIYLYDSNTVLHSKTSVIDDVWATVGSANLDNLSFRFNHEANVVSTDPSFIHEIKKHFLSDVKSSRELRLEEWKRRSFLIKLQEIIIWPLTSFL